LAAAVCEAVLRGWPYPRVLLEAAVRRARAEREIFADRAGLIKAYLARAKRLRRLDDLDPRFPEVTPMLDKQSPAPAYRLGGLFALGYYHQRQDLFSKRSREPALAGGDNPGDRDQGPLTREKENDS